MPRGDRTGPVGMGPMTGRGAGFCAGYDAPGYLNSFFGRGGYLSRGARGGGRGWRRWFFATGLPGWARFGAGAYPYREPDPKLEKQVLKDQMDALKEELESMQKRLDEIEKENP